MQPGAPFLCPDTTSDFDSDAGAMELSAQVLRMVGVTQALVASRRYVDLQGLHDHVGLLCAKALDLSPARNGFLKLELKRLACALASLEDSLRENAA